MDNDCQKETWTIDCGQNMFISHANELDGRGDIIVMVIRSAVKIET